MNSAPPETSQEQEIEAGSELPARTAGWLARLKSNFSWRKRAAGGPEPVDEADRQPSSLEIHREIGQQLRRRRELLSLTHEEIEQHIHVRAEFLKGLEEGALDELPSPVQSRGMLANYAAFLDLDADALLLRFADALQQGHRERYPEPTGRSRSPLSVSPKLPPLRIFIAGDMIFGIGVAVLLGVFAVWGLGRVITIQSQLNADGEAPSIPDVLADTAVPTGLQDVTVIPAADGPFASITPIAITEVSGPGADANLRLNIVAVELAYMRVTVDGKVVFDGRVSRGTAYPFDAQDRVEILTGNAAALRITYNGRDLGLMGNFGEVVDRVYTAQGVVTPTSTQPPTATATPDFTRTPSMTPSATPSLTRTPKP